MKKIKLNGKEYELKMRIKDLKEFGLVPNNAAENANKMTGIISGLLTGDVFTLVNVLEKLLKGQLKRNQIEECLENDEEINILFEQVEDFFETSPLTKKMAMMIAEPAKKALNSLD